MIQIIIHWRTKNNLSIKEKKTNVKVKLYTGIASIKDYKDFETCKY